MVEEYKIKAADLVEIADVIREKGNTTEQLVWPEGWKDAILNIKDSGVNLNFEVIGGTIQPEDPKENTIWINSETPISSWCFDSESPTNPEEGMIWFGLTIDGSHKFNALQENSIALMPASAWQYVNGSWQTIDTLIYQSGTWNDFNYYLLSSGSQKTPFTVSGTSGNYYVTSSLIQFICKAVGYAYMSSTQAIDLTPWTTLKVHGCRQASTGSCSYIYFGASTTGTANASFSSYTNLANAAGGAYATHSIDVSNLTGYYYIKAYMNVVSGDSNGFYFSSIWLE